MLDLMTRIAQLRRPPLLARAARFGVDDYRRNTRLCRILKCDTLPRHGAAITQLLEIEADMNAARLSRVGAYSPAAHVETLIALLGEAQLLRAQGLHLVPASTDQL